MTYEEKLNMVSLWNGVKDETIFPIENDFDMTPQEIKECFDKMFESLLK